MLDRRVKIPGAVLGVAESLGQFRQQQGRLSFAG
jgi:hypothetical protein